MMKKLSSSYIILIIVLGSITITTVLADTVTIATYPYTIQDGSSNQRLVITSSGNVGIGTSSPTSTLDVAQTSANSMIRLETTTSGNSMLDFLNNGNQEYQLVANRTTNHLEFWRPGISTSPIISMDPNSGAVGMDFLDVAKTSANSIIRSETTASGSSILDLVNNGNQEYQLVANRTTNHLEFWRPGISTSPIISMDPNSGNVGIGTSTPAQKLDISGNIRLTGNIVSSSDICIGSC